MLWKSTTNRPTKRFSFMYVLYTVESTIKVDFGQDVSYLVKCRNNPSNDFMNSERIRMSRNIYPMTSMKDDILYARDTSMHAIAVYLLHTQALICDLSQKSYKCDKISFLYMRPQH